MERLFPVPSPARRCNQTRSSLPKGINRTINLQPPATAGSWLQPCTAPCLLAPCREEEVASDTSFILFYQFFSAAIAAADIILPHELGSPGL